MEEFSLPGRQVELSRAGGSCLIIGLVILAVAITLIVVLLGDGHVRVNGHASRPSDVWVPTIFAVLGLSIAGFRWRKVIDLDAPAVIDEYTWLWLRWRQQEPLTTLCRVEIGVGQERGSSKNRYIVYPVRVHGVEHAKEVDANREILASRKVGERIARTAVIPLHDLSSGGLVIRAPGQLDQPYVHRMVEADLAVNPPDQASTMLAEGENGVVLTIPSFAGAVMTKTIGIIFVLVIVGAFLHRLGSWIWPSVGISGAAIVIVVMVLHRTGMLATKVNAGVVGLRVGRRTMPIDAMEELDVTSDSGIHRLRAISDSQMIEFGAGLSVEELRFIRAVILLAMRGR